MTTYALPKVELHCHLLGVINPALLRHLRQCGDSVLIDPVNLDGAYPVVDRASFQGWLDVLKPYQEAPLAAMRPIMAAHAASLIEQHVVYAEVMISPTMFPRDLDAMLPAFHDWREWTWSLEKGRVQIEFVMVVPRSLHPDRLAHDTGVFLELHRQGLIAGVAIVGPETGESIQRFGPACGRWRDAGLGIEIHAGEHSGPESIRDALRYGSPSRLGHGLSVFADDALLEEIWESKIHLEFCLTSNLRTAAVRSISEHPARRAKELEMNFSLNTDNPGAFECSLSSEFQLAAEELEFGPDSFEAVFRNSLAARFQPKLRYIG